MSNPRYTPRDYLEDPRDFGRVEVPEWRAPDESWTVQQHAQLAAAQLQHRVAFGVTMKFMPSSPTKKISTLARALDLKYDRVQKLLIGASVLQLEDLGRLRLHVGEDLDLWVLSPEVSAEVERWRTVALHAQREADARRAATARRSIRG